MGLRINTNVPSINAQRNLTKVSEALATSFRRLSSGLRISTAADDAAGLAISERLRSQIRSLDQAKRNANDGVSLVQTVEGGLNETTSLLTRLRELSIQSANGTTSDSDKATMNEEFTALVSEIDRIARSTSFNGVNLLDGASSTISLQVGFGTAVGIDTIDVTLSPALSTSLALNSLNISSTGNTSNAIAAIDSAINTVSSLRGRLGAVQNRLNVTVSNLSVRVENLSAAESRIRDVDIAAETATLTRNSVLQQAALAILGQANAQPQQALSLLR